MGGGIAPARVQRTSVIPLPRPQKSAGVVVRRAGPRLNNDGRRNDNEYENNECCNDYPNESSFSHLTITLTLTLTRTLTLALKRTVREHVRNNEQHKLQQPICRRPQKGQPVMNRNRTQILLSRMILLCQGHLCP